MRKSNKDHVKLKGISVDVYDDFNKAMKIFSKKVQESGILKEIRDRRYFETGAEIKKRRMKMAKKRLQKKLDRNQLNDK